MFDKKFLDILAECLYDNLKGKQVTKKRIKDYSFIVEGERP